MPVFILRRISVNDLDHYLKSLNERKSILDKAGQVSMRVFSDVSDKTNLTIFAEWTSLDEMNAHNNLESTKSLASKLGIKNIEEPYLFNPAFHRIMEPNPLSGYYILSQFEVIDSKNFVSQFKDHYNNDVLKDIGLKEILILMKMDQHAKIAVLGNWKTENHYKNWINSDLRTRDNEEILNVSPPIHTRLILQYYY